ncbi:Hypothetical predicted protein [Octopus vulgaris]|uniref:Uncharacterized protein n=1 Tax=Octopus vulgaris TaxID=6645 RepID=A0AA36AT64_OCTVU|nr:Hypothetical predicted protein [Octopus vulgaris]
MLGVKKLKFVIAILASRCLILSLEMMCRSLILRDICEEYPFKPNSLFLSVTVVKGPNNTTLSKYINVVRQQRNFDICYRMSELRSPSYGK